MNTPEEIQHLEAVMRHIQKVQDNCALLGRRLIESGEFELGRQLIANGFIHDNSKFHGVEWDSLRTDTAPTKLQTAVDHHNSTNPHHPEHWHGIENMPPVYLAEAVCDWAARSSEFGKSLIDWVEGDAMKRFKFKKKSKVHQELRRFVDLLCDPAFQAVKSE